MANKKNFLIIGAMVVVTVLAFLLINFFSGKGPTSSPSEVTEENLQQEIIDLEHNLLQLEVIFDEKEGQIDQLDELLQESYDRLASAEQNVEQLEQKINELERRGKVDKQTIAQLRNKLNEKRNKINEEKLKAYKVEIDLLVRDNGMLTAIRDSLEIVQIQKDSLITDMQDKVNDCLASNSATDTRPAINVDETPVVPVSSKPAGFYGKNFRHTYLNKRNKVVSLPSAKNLSEINIQFDIEGVDVPSGEEWIYIVMIDKSGKHIINKKVGIETSGGTFTYKGISRTYTHKHLMNYTGKPQHITTRYQTGSDFPNGKVTAYFYCKNKEIGSKGFFVSN